MARWAFSIRAEDRRDATDGGTWHGLEDAIELGMHEAQQRGAAFDEIEDRGVKRVVIVLERTE